MHSTLANLMPPTEQNDDSNSVSLTMRKDMFSAFFQAISVGIDAIEGSPPSPPHNTQDVDMLWSLTQSLIQASERTVTITNHEDHTVTNKLGQKSQLIFMEDGSCVDEEGHLRPKGDEKNEQLRLDHQIHDKTQELQLQCRQNIRLLMQEFWPDLLQLLSTHPTDEQFRELLAKAMLPKDVQTLMVNVLDQLLPKELRESWVGQCATSGLQHTAPALVEALIERIPDQLLDRFANQVTRLVNNLDPYEQMPFFTNFANKLVVSLGENRGVQSVAEALTKGYYKEICHADKRHLANAILALGCPKLDNNGQVNQDSMKTLVSEMTQAGGPGFQKAMQLFKGDIHIASIREALECMNSEVRPMPLADIKNIIAQDLRKVSGQPYALVNAQEYQANYSTQLGSHWPTPEKLQQNQLRKLGAATIAQTHEAFLWPCRDGVPQMDQPPVRAAIKVQRPMIAHRIRREMHALQRIPTIADSVSRTLKELENSIISETDFNREYQLGQLMGELYGATTNTAEFKPTKVVEMLGQGDRILIQKFSPGQSIQNHWSNKSAEFAVRFITDQSQPSSPASSQSSQHSSQSSLISLTPSEPDESSPQMNIELIPHGPATINITTDQQQITLRVQPHDPLMQTLKEYNRLYGETPSYAAAQHLASTIREYFTIDPLPKAKSLPEQAAFLDVAGQRVKTMIGQFAAAAFLGSDTPYALNFKSPEGLSTEQKAKQVFVSQQTLTQRQTAQQTQWTLQSFNANGQLQKKWTSSATHQHMTEQQTQTLITLLKAKQKSQNLSLELEGKLNQSVRDALNHAILFAGESFIDSDRHDGNLLFMDKPNIKDSELVCIDTGAGTIVSQYERYGMLKMGMGMASTNTDIIMEGLSQLIPGFQDRLADGGKALKADLEKSVQGEFIEDEKTQEIYQFLLKHSIVQGEENDRVFFHDLIHSPAHAYLKKHAFNFSQPAKSVAALVDYINSRKAAQHKPPIILSAEVANAFQDNLKKMDYGRVFAASTAQGYNPTHWVTDGHNSLIFIKSIRKIANILDNHNVYAPETIIQLNRGTKFLEDQLKRINADKIKLADKMKEVESFNANQTLLTAKVKQQLQPVNLGDAYINGVLSTKIVGDTFKALGWKTALTGASFLHERVKRVFLGSHYAQ